MFFIKGEVLRRMTHTTTISQDDVFVVEHSIIVLLNFFLFIGIYNFVFLFLKAYIHASHKLN